MSNARNRLRVVGGLMALVGVLVLPFGRLGVALLTVGFALLAVALVLPGSLYGKSPDPALAPVCPRCGLRMIFVQYQPDTEEYRCNEQGRYMLDSERLFFWPEQTTKRLRFWSRTKSD